MSLMICLRASMRFNCCTKQRARHYMKTGIKRCIGACKPKSLFPLLKALVQSGCWAAARHPRATPCPFGSWSQPLLLHPVSSRDIDRWDSQSLHMGGCAVLLLVTRLQPKE